MSKPESAPYGERMIEVRVRFFTNSLAGKNEVLPKQGWTRGVARITPNDTHGIPPGKRVHFNSLMELPLAIEKVLIDSEVTLHAAGRMANYVSS